MYLGIDLGGTKIEIIALDEARHELARQRVPTLRATIRATLAAIAGLVRKVEADLGTTGPVGIGTPGALSRATGTLKNSNSVCLIGRPLLADLERLLERPVRMENDANCFALSEATDGAASGAGVVFGVILGTGWEGASSFAAACLPGETQSPANGGTTPCRGLWTRNGRAFSVIAASTAASRPFSQGREWPAIISM